MLECSVTDSYGLIPACVKTSADAETLVDRSAGRRANGRIV